MSIYEQRKAARLFAANSVDSSEIADDSIVNADVNSSAAIAYSKLSMADSIVNADINSSAAIVGSKLATPARTHVSSVQIGSLSASQEKYLFVAPSACTIVNVTLVCDTATSGSDGSNNWAFQVADLTGAVDLMAAAVGTDTTEITANAVYDLTPDQNQVLAANDVLELQVTLTGAPTALSSAEIFAQVEYTV